MVNVQSKRLLAKLLAKENLTVVHSGKRTATFDIRRRILTLPIWKDMESEIYDLFILHEVAHALFSKDANLGAIWKKVSPQKPKAAKAIVNIVIDAKDEKLIKEMYPGGRQSFVDGYKLLLERNFFKIGDRDPNTMGILDRLNLHFKLGKDFGIRFSTEELPFVEMLENQITVEDSTRASIALYEFAKKQKNPVLREEIQNSANRESGQGIEDDELVDPDAADEDDDSPESETENSTDENPVAETETSFEDSRNELVDLNAKPIRYVTLPRAKLESIIVPYDQVSQEISHFYETLDRMRGMEYVKGHTQEYERFVTENRPIVDWLLQEFDIYQAADAQDHVQISDSGILDQEQLWRYRFDDNIFKQLATVVGGKSHSLEMFIDWSYSMTGHMLGTAHQLLNLLMFARKAQIQFNVYSFGAEPLYRDPHYNRRQYDYVEDDIVFAPNLQLRTLFSSEMTAREFKTAAINLLMMVSGSQDSNLPPTDTLGGTPLNETIVAAMEIVARNHESQIINCVFLTDGESNPFHGYNISPDQQTPVRMESFDMTESDVIIRDSQTQKEYHMLKSGGAETTAIFLQILRDRLDVNVVGFFVGGSAEDMAIYSPKEWSQPGSPERLRHQFERDHYVVATEAGYSEFYIMPPGNKLRIITGSVNPSDRSRMVIGASCGTSLKNQRVVLTRFIKLIS